MSEQFSVAGHEDSWNIFSIKYPSGNEILIRSRTRNAALHAFAADNFMARVHCQLPPEEIGPSCMPKSTAKLDSFEDALIAQLEAAQAKVYELAVTTGSGERILYFAGHGADELQAALAATPREFAAKLQLIAEADRAKFLKLITLSREAEATANKRPLSEAGRSQPEGRGFLGKLFGR